MNSLCQKLNNFNIILYYKQFLGLENILRENHSQVFRKRKNRYTITV